MPLLRGVQRLALATVRGCLPPPAYCLAALRSRFFSAYPTAAAQSRFATGLGLGGTAAAARGRLPSCLAALGSRFSSAYPVAAARSSCFATGLGLGILSPDMMFCGGVHDAPGREKDPDAIELARFAVDEHNSKTNAALEFVRLVKVRHQLVAGHLQQGDYRRAEYYSRAILADPDDGELLSEYAKLVWDVHRDEERANSCFERAAKASPQNSHVLAAHAAFLWDTDDDDKEGAGDVLGSSCVGAGFAQPAYSSTLASATT